MNCKIKRNKLIKKCDNGVCYKNRCVNIQKTFLDNTYPMEVLLIANNPPLVIKRNTIENEINNIIYELIVMLYVNKFSRVCPKIYDWYYNNKQLTIVMEYIKGQVLEEWSKNKTYKKRLEIYKKIDKEIFKLHKICVVHNDLHQYNIIITDDENIKFIDFGLSYIVDPHDAAKEERTNPLFYMFPHVKDFRYTITPSGVLQEFKPLDSIYLTKKSQMVNKFKEKYNLI